MKKRSATAKSEEPKCKKKRQTKTMNKSTRKTLQASIRAIDTSVLVGKFVTDLRKQCFDGSLATLVNELWEAKDLLPEMV